MTRHGPALLALSMVAIASWAYSVNYDTRAALDRLSKLRAEIAAQREALQVLRVEWAYLNAPDRLSALVAAHNDVLALTPLVPEKLGIVAAVPYPPRETPDIAPTEPEALIASAPVAPVQQERAPAAPARPELAAGGSAAATPAVGIAAPVPAVPRPSVEAETVPAALEASIAAALVAVGVPLEGVGRSTSASGSVPAARPVAWSVR